jgi:hypothetical protein
MHSKHFAEARRVAGSILPPAARARRYNSTGPHISRGMQSKHFAAAARLAASQLTAIAYG